MRSVDKFFSIASCILTLWFLLSAGAGAAQPPGASSRGPKKKSREMNASPNAWQLNLAGTWGFQADSQDRGAAEAWFNKPLAETISLPGSMAGNGKGDLVSIHTSWTGDIIDKSWFTAPKYARYRQEGNVKVPFWLQPERYYKGAAWYQKTVEIPASWSGRLIELVLERPHWETQIWVDGQPAGKQNRLGTPHVYDLTRMLPPGKHLLSIRVDNRVKEVDPGPNSHSISDHTQSNWNGIVGALALHARPAVALTEVQLFPDVAKKQVLARIHLQNQAGVARACQLTLNAHVLNGKPAEQLKNVVQEIVVSGAQTVEVIYPMGDNPLLWDEFTPNLYSMLVTLKSVSGTDQKKIVFGMRDFKAAGTQFSINGRPVFLRGTLECAIFPKTGYPPTGTGEWKRIFSVCKAFGLNHMRFHSWCPPEAAFDAADELGVYLQVECSSWANQGSSLGDGKPIDEWIYQEAQGILSAFGNHPSFCMLAYGNEPAGKNQVAYLRKWLAHFKMLDPRRLYTSAAGWPFVENADYFSDPAARIQAWGQELKSVINGQAPQTLFDYRDKVRQTPMPYVSHEIGQWCVYPNFKEMPKYDGALKARNFEIFKETLEENGMGLLADSFLLASGKLQALCYKADIEAALRTPGFGGFQLLDLHDFPGQGTALVGVLDPFWEEKGYITAAEYSRFCNQTVPLARLAKRVYYDSEPIVADIEVAHFGKAPLRQTPVNWTLTTAAGQPVASGQLPSREIPWGNGIALGKIETAPRKVDRAQKWVLEVEVAGFSNTWDIWVYPSENKAPDNAASVRVVQELDGAALEFLRQGGSVLLTPLKDRVKPEKGGSVGIGFSSIFWNTAWTGGQKPHTLGILCDPNHPALSDFPTEYHSNWQWWDAMSHSNALLLDGLSPAIQPIVRVIDDWVTNRRLALVFETRVGKGRLVVSGIDLLTDSANRPEARQLLYSLTRYMAGARFNPAASMEEQEVLAFFK